MLKEINTYLKDTLETLKVTAEKMAAEYNPVETIEETTQEELAKKEPEKMDDEETEVEATDEAPKADEKEPEAPSIEDTVSSHTDAIAQQQAQLDSIAQTLTEVKELIQSISEAANGDAENFKSQLTELTDTVKKIAGMPKEFSKTNNSPIVVNERQNKMFDLAASFSRINK